MLLSKATYNKCIHPWGYKPRTTRIKKVQFSSIGKCSISATKSLDFVFVYIQGIVGRDVFLVCRGRYVDFLLSWCHWGAPRSQDSIQSRFCCVISSQWSEQQADWQMQSGVNRLACNVWPCPGCKLDPIRSQHGTQVLMFWNGCGRPLVTSEGSGGAE